MAVEILGEAFANLNDSSDAESVMRTAIERANTAIYQMAHELPQLSSMATTIVALHLNGNIATIGHVGDSRLYRVDRDGNLFRETDDHSMVAEEVRAGRMTEEQAENHPSRNVISRALGAELTVEPELKTIMIDPGTAFLLCSDGVTRHVADNEIKGVLTFGGGPEDVCEYIKGLCYERGAEDNLTAVVVRVAARNGALSLADEEDTLATARAAAAAARSSADELLELDTHQMTAPPEVEQRPIVSNETIEISSEDKIEVPITENRLEKDREMRGRFDGFAMAPHPDSPASSSSRIIIYLAILVVGGLLGFFAYYFAAARPEPEPQPVVNQISEMSSPNIAMTSFEKNRRNVDSDPAGYIAKGPTDPQDAEDNYLLGRAYLLTEDYVKARASFLAARDLLGQAEPSTAKVLAADIAAGLALTNNTTIQGIFRNEVNAAAKAAVNANTSLHTNANR